MAGIDEKMNALSFVRGTTKSHEQIMQIVADASELGASLGGKILVTQESTSTITIVVKNFVRVTHGVCLLAIEGAEHDPQRTVRFDIDDYLRTRDTVMFIPVSPWSAPAYKPIRTFVEHLHANL
ncbi:hypothetical protein ACXR2T_09285 [Leucobacter sp. HY1910]